MLGKDGERDTVRGRLGVMRIVSGMKKNSCSPVLKRGTGLGFNDIDEHMNE